LIQFFVFIQAKDQTLLLLFLISINATRVGSQKQDIFLVCRYK